MPVPRPALLIAAFLLGGPGRVEAEDVIRDVRVVDVAAGTVSEPQDLTLRDGVVAAMAPTGGLLPKGAATHDAGGGYAIPGLWDMHVHVFSSPEEHLSAFPLYLLNGVTGIRDMGALLTIQEQQRIAAEVEDGAILGPRVILSGAWIDAPPGSWPGMFLAATPEEGHARVDEIAAQGWAAVKSYSMLSEPAYLAVAEEAEKLGLPLVGHVPEGVTLGTALAAGHASMEHFGRLTQACSTEEEAMVARVREALGAEDPRSALIAELAGFNRIVLETWNEALCEEVVARVAEAPMHVVPTLVVADFYLGVRPAADSLRMRTLPAAVREAWAQPDFRLQAMTDEIRALADQSIALDWRTFAMAQDGGVPILAGTDASFANPYIFHGFSLLDELDRYVEAGLDPREALTSATVAPARFLGLPDQDGTLAVGRRADLVVVAANPLDGLATLREPLIVVAGGRVLDAAALEGLEQELLERSEP